MTYRARVLCPPVLLCSLFAGCGEVVYDDDVQPIFTASCASSLCHDGDVDDPDLGEELNLTAGASYAAIVGVSAAQAPDLNLVEPGDVEGSYLWHKLADTHEAVGGEGECMPYLLCASMTEKELTTIESWIADGALEVPE